jgi:aspartyl-tRNA(Asn)/glutamyl-tRNA(Gln) amidotransferase subunit C
MALTRDEVRRIAELARLELDDAGLDRIAAELGAVLDFVEELRRLDLAGCEPTELARAAGALRADVPDDGRRLRAAEAVAGSAEAEDGFFLVPPIVENVNP